MTRVFLGLGSNVGDRKKNLEDALTAIGALPLTRLEKVSGFMGSKPQGKWREGESGGDFLNCCASVLTLIPPHLLLARLKRIERAMGRVADNVAWRCERIYSDRPIDIDILLYGNRKINTASLQVPHPHMQERDFVMKPLQQINK